jgi:hypothetical protein
MITWPEINIVEMVVFVLFAVGFFLLIIDDIRLRFKNYNLNAEVQQFVINYMILNQKLEEMAKQHDAKKLEDNDGFVKFLSESRDWAFQYIEDVQKSIESLEQAAAKVPIVPKSYLTTEQLEDLKTAIAEVIRQLPEKSKND